MNNTLEHYGVKGMRWGKKKHKQKRNRRYKNVKKISSIAAIAAFGGTHVLSYPSNRKKVKEAYYRIKDLYDFRNPNVRRIRR